MKKKNNSTLIAAIVFVAVIALVVIVNAVSGENAFTGTAWALIPPFVAIALALITKEVYSSLFIGTFLGAFMYSHCNLITTIDNLIYFEGVNTAGDDISGGISSAVAGNAGILVFLVILGAVVALVNKSGASKAFGAWAQTHIKTKVGAGIATILLGVLIFIDDYFNCLTVGSVMSPVTDSKKISRVKLAYIIDATAAPVCMIAPVSSWAAAVSGCVESETYSAFGLFVRAIPYNFYSIFTLLFLVVLTIMSFDYGKMSEFEIKAQNGDLSILDTIDAKDERKIEDDGPSKEGHGRLFDLFVPIVLLIVLCVLGLYHNGVQASDGEKALDVVFGNTDAYVGLPWGCIIALILIVLYFVARKVISFKDAMECIPKGFMAMVPAITILTLATSLKDMTKALEYATFVEMIMRNAESIRFILPAVVFLIACVIAFATGTSWGTFGILIPLVQAVFPETSSLFFVGISACLAGAVCGDHCSPISDTTIMASAGAHCNHVDHVSTQLPYVLSVASISFITYLLAGIFDLGGFVWLSIPVGAALTVGFLFFMKAKTAK